MVDMPKRNGRGIELLADPTRRRIIALLALRPWRPSVLAAELGLGRPATTRQLHLLEEAGLVHSNRSMGDGRVVLYTIERRQHGPILAWLAGTEIVRPTTPIGHQPSICPALPDPE
jgi:predicted transcriptional regulator